MKIRAGMADGLWHRRGCNGRIVYRHGSRQTGDIGTRKFWKYSSLSVRNSHSPRADSAQGDVIPVNGVSGDKGSGGVKILFGNEEKVEMFDYHLK